MAEQFESNDDRTEEATPERREEFREKGQIAVSREISSVAILAASVGFISFYATIFTSHLKELFITHFERITSFKISTQNALEYWLQVAQETTILIIPFFIVTAIAATATTFGQTRLNFSWQRLKPDFNKIDPLKGVMRIVNMQAVMEVLKGLCKMTAVGIVTYLILKSEWIRVPGLMGLHIVESFHYWGAITQNLFWSVAILMLFVGGIDYIYNFISLERKLKMTKREVKEEFKRREVDPHIKARMRRMQRDLASRRMIEKTRQATVVITNPTHYAIALKYELGMQAPVVLAKGTDFLAMRMREAAQEVGIPLVENKPLARTLYKVVEIGQEIPESLYKAVSEIIRYVFKLKRVNYNTQNT